MPDLLDDLLKAAMRDHGKDKFNKKGQPFRAIPKEERFETIRELIQSVKDAGQPKEFFFPTPTKNKIIELFFPEHYTRSWSDKKSVRNVFSMVTREIENFVEEIWDDVKLSKPKVVEKPKEEEKPKADPKQEFEMYNKPVTPEDLKDAPAPNVVWDDDLEKKLRGE